MNSRLEAQALALGLPQLFAGASLNPAEPPQADPHVRRCGSGGDATLPDADCMHKPDSQCVAVAVILTPIPFSLLRATRASGVCGCR